MRSNVEHAIMSLLNWLMPPVKCSHIYITEYSNNEEEYEPEEDDEVTLDVTPDLTSDSSIRYTSTRSNSRSSCSKQSKCFNTVWLKGRKHWLKYEEGVGMFCTL